jgi:hypothetical protein
MKENDISLIIYFNTKKNQTERCQSLDNSITVAIGSPQIRNANSAETTNTP